MNLKIKFRESFRPFAPSVLRERVGERFDMGAGQESPYMLLVAPVSDAERLPEDEAGALTGFDRLKLARSTIPAVTHVDYSARIQTVDEARHGRYHRLLRAFARKTGCPAVINTNFNVRGEPIVCTPEQAHRCFLSTGMDALVVERHLLIKSEQPGAASGDTQTYLAQFELD